MNISPNISDIVLLITSSQSLFLAVFIYHKYGFTLPNKMLSVTLFAYSILFINLFLWEMQAYTGFEVAGLFLSGMAFLISPLHYLYTIFLSRKENKFKLKYLLHALPFFIYNLVIIIFLLFQPDKPPADNNSEIHLSTFGMLINWAISLQGLIYTIIIISVINRYSKRIKEVFSSLDNIKLGWLRNITIIFSISFVVFIIENTLVSSSYIVNDKFDLSSMIAAIAVYLIGYIGLFKSEVFTDPEFVRQLDEYTIEEKEVPDNSSKYIRSGLSEQKAVEKLEELLALMSKEAPYTNSNLTLIKLAEMLNISSHNLSEILNTRLNKNFFDFINSYRVEKVKADLLDDSKKKYTLLALAVEAGFNSKSAFNLVFKKFTGTTPTEYRKRKV